jgi:hypothetical protein
MKLARRMQSAMQSAAQRATNPAAPAVKRAREPSCPARREPEPDGRSVHKGVLLRCGGHIGRRVVPAEKKAFSEQTDDGFQASGLVESNTPVDRRMILGLRKGNVQVERVLRKTICYVVQC